MALDDFFPSRTARLTTLDGIDPRVRHHFEALIRYAERQGWGPAIVSVTRSAREQLHTASQVKCSWHLFGRAMDLELRGRANQDDYETLGRWWEFREGDEHGQGHWGGDWKSYGEHGDYMHFHWAPSGGVPDELCTPETAASNQLAWWADIHDSPRSRKRRKKGLGGVILAAALVGGVYWYARSRR